MMVTREAPPRQRAFQQAHLRWRTAEGSESLCQGWLRPVTSHQLIMHLGDEHPRPVSLPVGQTVQIEMAIPSGLALIPARLRHYDPVAGVMGLAVAGPIAHHERRVYPRVAVNLPPVQARLMQTAATFPQQFTVHLCDLSAGGARFVCQTPLRPLEQIQLILRLDSGPPLRALMTVLESRGGPAGNSDLDGAAPTSYRVRGAFTQLAAEERQRLIDYITRQQVAELRSFL